MKLTTKKIKELVKEELKKILAQEVEDHDGDGAMGSGFPSDVPFIEYEEAKNDRPDGSLPQLRAAKDNKPAFFMTKIGDKNYPSVYTKWKPSSKEASRYQKMGVGLIWADSRYGIGNWSPSSIVGINKHAAQMRRDAQQYGNYHYLPEDK